MIGFRTVSGTRVWVQPHQVICVFEVPSCDVGNLETKEKMVAGVLVFPGNQFFVTIAEAENVVRKLASESGDEWRATDLVED